MVEARILNVGAFAPKRLLGDKEAFSIEGEAMAWELAALAVHHLNALGCYRAPTPPDGPTIFLAITELKRISQ